jgi:hypothetical protein
MPFNSLDELIAANTVSGSTIDGDFARVGTQTQAAGIWHSLWTVGSFPGAGGNGAAGSGTPGAGGTALSIADGSLVKIPDQTLPITKHLTEFIAWSDRDCTIMLYDRLVSISGISLVGTGNKNVNSVALPRYTTGEGVEVWLEVTTATTTTAAVISMNSYTDESGNGTSAGATLTFPAAATRLSAFIGPMPLASGDYGVRSVETLNVATAAATGVVNVVLIKPLVYLSTATYLSRDVDLVGSLPRLFNGASLGMAVMTNGSQTINVWGKILGAYK